jgi:diguanylate cyclase (GGDEF)-like protein
VRVDHPDELWTPAEEHADAIDGRWRIVVLVAAGFEALIGLANLLRLAPPANLVMAVTQGLAAAALLALWQMLRHRSLPHRTAQPVLAASLTVFALHLPLEMALTDNALLTANVGLILVLAGTLLVQTRWFVATVVVVVGTWLAVLVTGGPWPEPEDRLILYIGVACLVAILVHVVRVQSRTRLLAALDEARAGALRDDLTGLWNRRGARVAARPLLGEARRSGEPTWAITLRLDGLAEVNRISGAPTGDRLVLAVGRTLAQCEDGGCVAVRRGGGEFALIGEGSVPDVDDLIADIVPAIAQVAGTVDQPWHLEPGVAVIVGATGPDAVDRLLAAADADLSPAQGRPRAPDRL